MVGPGNPVESGLVSSLARPGGNVTGNTILGPEVVAKRLQIFKEAVPSLSRVALLWNPENVLNAHNPPWRQIGLRDFGRTRLLEQRRPPVVGRPTRQPLTLALVQQQGQRQGEFG
jgi:hypothetical protein